MKSPPNPTAQASSLSPRLVHGIAAWIDVVCTYQACAETLSERVKTVGLKLAQHDVLMNLLRSESLTQQQLAQKSFVTKSHMSAVLTEMVELGWIDRSDSQADKRSKEITLTPPGRQLAHRAFALQAQVVTAMMGNLSDTELTFIQDFSSNAQKALKALRESR